MANGSAHTVLIVFGVILLIIGVIILIVGLANKNNTTAWIGGGIAILGLIILIIGGIVFASRPTIPVLVGPSPIVQHHIVQPVVAAAPIIAAPPPPVVVTPPPVEMVQMTRGEYNEIVRRLTQPQLAIQQPVATLPVGQMVVQ